MHTLEDQFINLLSSLAPRPLDSFKEKTYKERFEEIMKHTENRQNEINITFKEINS